MKEMEPGYGYLEDTLAHAFFPIEAERRIMEFNERINWNFDLGYGNVTN